MAHARWVSPRQQSRILPHHSQCPHQPHTQESRVTSLRSRSHSFQPRMLLRPHPLHSPTTTTTAAFTPTQHPHHLPWLPPGSPLGEGSH